MPKSVPPKKKTKTKQKIATVACSESVLGVVDYQVEYHHISQLQNCGDSFSLSLYLFSDVKDWFVWKLATHDKRSSDKSCPKIGWYVPPFQQVKTLVGHISHRIRISQLYLHYILITYPTTIGTFMYLWVLLFHFWKMDMMLLKKCIHAWWLVFSIPWEIKMIK